MDYENWKDISLFYLSLENYFHTKYVKLPKALPIVRFVITFFEKPQADLAAAWLDAFDGRFFCKRDPRVEN